MSKFLGRKVFFTPMGSPQGANPTIGATALELNILGEPLDETDFQSDGWQTFNTDDVARRGVDGSISGQTTDQTFIEALKSGDGIFHAVNYKLGVFLGGSPEVDYTGNWVFYGFTQSNPEGELATFSCSFHSNGALT